MEFLGKTLGNYRIDRLLGEGGMGAVYHAFDLTLQREVAIKLIHPHYARRPEFRDRFMQEARLMARLDHPGIVKVFILGKEGDLLYLPMEFIKGGNLRQLLDRLIQQRKWIPLSEAVLLMRQLCQTVNYAHEHDVLHRDIKPANLMLKPEPTDGLPFRVILTDLGLAKLLQGLGMTQERMYIGTPAYMSPEQASGRNTDARSDVYSLGILLYELAVGRLPFPIQTPTEAIRYHTQERPPSPRSLRPDLPEALERVILKSLEKAPANRYASAAVMSMALNGTISLSTEIPNQPVQQDISLSTVYDNSLIEVARPESASLMTMFDGGSLPPRGESIFAGKSVPPSSQTRIQVVYKEKTAQVFPLRSGTVTIGRGPNNDVPISDPKASQRHAQVTWDGMEYHVMDLDSKNGTYLGNTKLLPGMPEVWRPNQNLRIGDAWLRLIRPAAEASQVSGIRSGISGMRSRSGSGVYTSSGAGLVGVSVNPQKLSVEPGESVTGTLSLLNQNLNVDHFSLSITGIPGSWISSLPSSVQLMPGEQKETAYSLVVPRSPQSQAGARSMILRVTSESDPSQFVEVKLTLTIAAYSQFKAELQPQRLRAGQPGRITISNQGNAPETFSLQFTDAAGELVFEPSQPQIQVAAGATTQLVFHPKESQRRWFGGERIYPLAAKVSLSNGENQTLHADMVSRDLIPIWVLPSILLLCLLCIGSIIRFSLPLPQTPNVSLTTPLLLANPQNTPVQTDLAQSLSSPVQQVQGTQTSQAQTQTAQAQQPLTSQAQQVQGTQTSLAQTQTAQAQQPLTGQAQQVQQTLTSQALQAQQTQTIQAQQVQQTLTSQALQAQQTQTSQALTSQVQQIPTTTITSQPSNLSNSRTAVFNFIGTGISFNFECQLDSGSFTACTAPISYNNLNDGIHTFQVRARDALGNTDPSPASFTWTIDATGPTVTINQAVGQPEPAETSPINFTVVFSEEVIGFDEADIDFTGSTFSATLTATVAGSGTTYNVAVAGMKSFDCGFSRGCRVTASVKANTVVDAAGNNNLASTSLDNTVVYFFIAALIPTP